MIEYLKGINVAFFKEMLLMMKERENKKIIISKYINEKEQFALFFISSEEKKKDCVFGHICISDTSESMGVLFNNLQYMCDRGYAVVIELDYWIF